MTRSEAHNKVKDWINESSNDKDKNLSCFYGKKELHRDIDRIYDDFEIEKENIFHAGVKNGNESIEIKYSNIFEAIKRAGFELVKNDNGYILVKI